MTQTNSPLDATRASNSELVKPLPETEHTLNERLRQRNRIVPFEQRNDPPQQPRVVYVLILDINYFRNFLVTLQNLNPMDDDPGSVLGYKVSEVGLEVNKAKINEISKLPPLLISKLLEKDTPFELDDEGHNALKLLNEKLTCALVIVSPNWNLPFELMCDASDFAVGAILGQKD
nr:DNA-directed DNA polymerase [Tanacetum cinerariifolium]